MTRLIDIISTAVAKYDDFPNGNPETLAWAQRLLHEKYRGVKDRAGLLNELRCALTCPARELLSYPSAPEGLCRLLSFGAALTGCLGLERQDSLKIINGISGWEEQDRMVIINVLKEQLG